MRASGRGGEGSDRDASSRRVIGHLLVLFQRHSCIFFCPPRGWPSRLPVARVTARLATPAVTAPAPPPPPSAVFAARSGPPPSATALATRRAASAARTLSSASPSAANEVAAPPSPAAADRRRLRLRRRHLHRLPRRDAPRAARGVVLLRDDGGGGGLGSSSFVSRAARGLRRRDARLRRRGLRAFFSLAARAFAPSRGSFVRRRARVRGVEEALHSTRGARDAVVVEASFVLGDALSAAATAARRRITSGWRSRSRISRHARLAGLPNRGSTPRPPRRGRRGGRVTRRGPRPRRRRRAGGTRGARRGPRRRDLPPTRAATARRRGRRTRPHARGDRDERAPARDLLRGAGVGPAAHRERERSDARPPASRRPPARASERVTTGGAKSASDSDVTTAPRGSPTSAFRRLSSLGNPSRRAHCSTPRLSSASPRSR